jgi:hypothetical protein
MWCVNILTRNLLSVLVRFVNFLFLDAKNIFLVLRSTKAIVDYFFEFVFLWISLKMETSSVSKRLLFQMVIHKCAIQMFLHSWSMFTIGRYTWIQINSNVFNLSHCLSNSTALFPLISLCFWHFVLSSPSFTYSWWAWASQVLTRFMKLVYSEDQKPNYLDMFACICGFLCKIVSRHCFIMINFFISDLFYYESIVVLAVSVKCKLIYCYWVNL